MVIPFSNSVGLAVSSRRPTASSRLESIVGARGGEEVLKLKGRELEAPKVHDQVGGAAACVLEGTPAQAVYGRDDELDYHLQ